MNNENAVMKKSLSTEGNDVFLVRSVDDIIKNIGDIRVPHIFASYRFGSL